MRSQGMQNHFRARSRVAACVALPATHTAWHACTTRQRVGVGVTHRDMESDVDAGLDRDLACPIPFCDAARWRRPLNDAGAWNGVAMGSMAAAMAHPASDFAAIVCDFFEDLSSISLS